MNNEVANVGVNLKALVDYYVNTFVSSNGQSDDLEGLHDVVIGTLEKFLITTVLEKCRGNKVRAAKVLGLHRNTLSQKLKLMANEDGVKATKPAAQKNSSSFKKKVLPKVVLLKGV